MMMLPDKDSGSGLLFDDGPGETGSLIKAASPSGSGRSLVRMPCRQILTHQVEPVEPR
jgi:hypothetical protein